MKNKNRKTKLIIIAVIAVIVLVLDAWGFSLKPVSYTVQSDKLTAPVRIVFVSDLHNCFYGGHDQSGLWDAIEEAKPDIVLFGGDVIDRSGGSRNALKIMGMAADKYPCAYAAGNHETGRKDKNAFYAEVEKLGIPVLHGKYTDITVNGQKVRVLGVRNASAWSGKSLQLANCYEAIAPDAYNILLAHEPQELRDITFESANHGGKTFDLVLSGHAHGGQWRIPGLLEHGLYAPDQGLFPDFTTGQRTESGTTQIVSRGLARNMKMIMIPRIFNRPELSVIELTP